MNDRDIPAKDVQVEALTWREQEILALLAEHLTNREIADRLHLAESTVKDYVGRILGKLYVNNRRQAVVRAKTLGLFDSDLKTRSVPPSNLPPEPTPFVGRTDELSEIQRRLAETRLLTLTGPGGIGKTRLALKAAQTAAGDFEDGRFLVALAPIRALDQFIQTIAEAIKFPLATQADPQSQLLRYLKHKKLLLVMDNFEHLLDGAAAVSQILQAAPGVKVLATSRERLNLQSECLIQVGGMDLPDGTEPKHTLDYGAVVLFVQSARKVRPEFDPSPGELGLIVKICQIVLGMPLAIELAAAWLQLLSLDDIYMELEQGIDILEGEMRDAPARHRSIRAVFDHSWSLLDQTERQVFQRLSIFRGGFTRQAAQQIAGASLKQLMGLVNKSLLNHDPDTGRLEVHELLRQYAQEQLERRPEARRATQEAHAAYFAELMQQQGERLKGRGQLQALAEIEADIENVRTAWQYYLERRNVSQMWLFIYGLWHVYWIRWWNHAGMALFAQAIRVLEAEEGEDAQALWALAMVLQSFFMAWLDLPDQGHEQARKGVDILKGLNQDEALLYGYIGLHLNAYLLGRISDYVSISRAMLESVPKTDDKWLKAYSLFAASMGKMIVKDYTEAGRLAESNLEICEEIEDVIGSSLPLVVLGDLAWTRGEYAEARAYYLRCLKISKRTGFPYGIQTSSKYLGKVALSLGDIAEARKYLAQSLRISNEIGFIRDVVNLLYEYARLEQALGFPERAVELLGLVIQHPTSQSTRMLEGRIRDGAEALLATLESDLPPEAFTAALARGRRLDLDAVIVELIGR